MARARIRGLVERAGVLRLLHRFGLRAPVADLLRLAGSRTERARWRLIKRDYMECRRALRRLVAGMPPVTRDRIAWVVCSMPTVWGLKLDGVMSLIVRLAGYFPVGVHVGGNTWARRYHALFGIEQFLDLEAHRSWDGIEATSRQGFVEDRPTIGDVLGVRYRDVDVGRIALSNFLNRRKFSGLDLGDPGTLAELERDMGEIRRNVHAAERMVAACRPHAALLLEKGVSPIAEVAGVCMREGIPVVQYVNAQSANQYVFKRFGMDNRHQHPFSLDQRTWDEVKRMSWGPEQASALMQELVAGYRTGSWFNRKFLHHAKQIKPRERVQQQLGLDPARKTAVIFAHVLWDATFFYGESLFDDYENWLVETVKAACRNPRVNWLVKLHPDLVWKVRYEGHIGELRDLLAIRSAVPRVPEHVKIIPPETDISTYSFFEVADYCVTVRGTIGIEMACHGIPVLTAGTGRYSGLGFTIDSISSAEYLARLASIESIPRMDAEGVRLAQRFAHALFRLRPWPMRSFEMVRLPLEMIGHPLDHNLVARVGSFEEFAADVRRVAEWMGSDEVDFLGGVGAG